jgi:hypothetical protein
LWGAGGTTILLVTHVVFGLASVCDRVMVLENGRLVFDGEPGLGVDRYYQLFFMSPELPVHDGASDELRYGAGGAAIGNVFVSRDGEHATAAFASGDEACVIFDVAFMRDIEAPQFGFACSTKEGTHIYATTSSMLGDTPQAVRASERRRIHIAFRVDVTVSDLFIDLSVFEVVHGSITVFDARMGVLHITVAPPLHCSGITDLGAAIRVVG